MNIQEKLMDNHIKGYCCSESVMNLGLEDLGKTPEEQADLIKAMGAFCGGLRHGLACGALCAANAILFIAEEDGKKAKEEHQPELMEWFKDHYGAWNCEELLGGDPSRKETLCPNIIEETYLKVHDILEDAGVI